MIDYERYRGTIFSRKGGWRMGSGIDTHGYSLLDDIHGKVFSLPGHDYECNREAARTSFGRFS